MDRAHRDGLISLSCVDLAKAIRERRTSSVAAMEAVLERAHAVQPRLNCFLRIDDDAALAAAHLADREVARGYVRGPLHGVPMAHKDMYYRRGVVSTCGSKILRDTPAAATAKVLEHLDAAGAIQFGVLNMAEFAMGPTGHNWHYGHCRNPWDPERVTGGSSSGSGASVAARANFAALGSDTGGSIRLPSAFCGLAGIRPTHGRVSVENILPLCPSLDTVGPLTRTVEDAALMLEVIAPGFACRSGKADRRPAYRTKHSTKAAIRKSPRRWRHRWKCFGGWAQRWSTSMLPDFCAAERPRGHAACRRSEPIPRRVVPDPAAGLFAAGARAAGEGPPGIGARLSDGDAGARAGDRRVLPVGVLEGGPGPRAGRVVPDADHRRDRYFERRSGRRNARTLRAARRGRSATSACRWYAPMRDSPRPACRSACSSSLPPFDEATALRAAHAFQLNQPFQDPPHRDARLV